MGEYITVCVVACDIWTFIYLHVQTAFMVVSGTPVIRVLSFSRPGAICRCGTAVVAASDARFEVENTRFKCAPHRGQQHACQCSARE